MLRAVELPVQISSRPEPHEPEDKVEIGAGSHFPTLRQLGMSSNNLNTTVLLLGPQLHSPGT